MPFQAMIEKDFMVKVPKEYVQGMKLHEGDFLTLDVVPLIGQKGTKQLETELSYAQEYEVSMNTLHHFVPIWMANFKANLPLFVEGAKGYPDIPPTEGAKKKCVIVANGPSLYETDLSPLAAFDGTVITTNKPLKHLLKMGIIPDWVAVLDAGPETWASFDDSKDSIVKDFAPYIKGIFLPTVVEPKVAKFSYEAFGKEKVFWHNPHFSDAIAPNICETLTSITKIPSCEHGGNVGSFAYLMALRPLYCNPLGLLGFDLSYQPSKDWSLEQTTHYRFFYIPEMDHHYALSPVFEYYIARLLELQELSSEKMGALTVNLTPVGPLNAVVGLSKKTLQEFCEVPTEK